MSTSKKRNCPYKCRANLTTCNSIYKYSNVWNQMQGKMCTFHTWCKTPAFSYFLNAILKFSFQTIKNKKNRSGVTWLYRHRHNTRFDRNQYLYSDCEPGSVVRPWPLTNESWTQSLVSGLCSPMGFLLVLQFLPTIKAQKYLDLHVTCVSIFLFLINRVPNVTNSFAAVSKRNLNLEIWKYPRLGRN